MKRRILLAFIFLINACYVPVGQAAFSDQSAGARAAGMADTFVAVADDANALYYNPSGLTQLPDAEITTLYGQLMRGFDDGSRLGTSYFGYAQPLRGGELGTFGAGYHQFNAADLFTERTMMLSYGRYVRTLPTGWDGVLAGGFSLKQLSREFEPDRFTENGLNDAGTATGEKDPLFARNGYKKTAYALDLGGLYRFGPRYRYSAGVSLMNVNQPDVSLAGDGDKAPMAVKIGLATRLKKGLVSAEARRTKRLAGKSDLDLAFGAEHRFRLSDFGAIDVRGGYAEGARDYKAFTAGLSYVFSRMTLDYAFGMPVAGLETDGSHRFGFTLKLGSGRSDLKAKSLSKEDPKSFDLLKSFSRESRASHAALDRFVMSGQLDQRHQMVLLQYLLRKYSFDDPGNTSIRAELSALLSHRSDKLMSWDEIKSALLLNIKGEDRRIAENGLEYALKGQPKTALSRWVLLSQESQSDLYVKGIVLTAHAESASVAYRGQDYDAALEHVWKMVEMLPDDPRVMDAYRRILLLRTEFRKQSVADPVLVVPQNKGGAVEETEVELPVVEPEFEPEPEPRKAVAPVPPAPAQGLSNYEVIVQNYGVALSYYFERKLGGASRDELEHLLQQMRAVYGRYSIDLSLIDKEQESLKGTAPKAMPVIEQPVPAPKKATPKLSAPKPVETLPAVAPATKPAKALTRPKGPTEFDKSWRYFEQAVEEGISDREKIQLLESIVNKHGLTGTEKAQEELRRMKKGEKF